MEAIDNLVAEFFILRSQQNPRARVSSSNLFSSLKLQDTSDSLNLKVSSVLRDISDSLIRGTIDESTLDLLEILAKLLQQEQSLVESHKSAFCWTAVESTVRFMCPLSLASNGLFVDAFERIWNQRIGILKESGSDLVSDELLKWEIDFKKALVDLEMYEKIRERNVRYVAVSFITKLLDELRVSSLESVAQRILLKSSDDHVNDLENEDHNKVARELKDFCLEIQGYIMEQEANNGVTPRPNRINKTRRDGQDHSEEAPDNNVNEKGSDSQRTSSSSSSSSRRVRPQLPPTPEPRIVSPLNTIRAEPNPRRAKRAKLFWTAEEVEALREGVKEYGRSWRDIKNENPIVFAKRTVVDLKDKWRNLNGRGN